MVQAPLQSELHYVFKSTSTDQKSSFWSSSIAILSPSFPFDLFYWPESSPLYFIIQLLSSLISSFFFIYLLSILVEVLLRLLTYRRDLVLLYLVSEDHS
jgi:ABC-type thiamin/hydroxymethylpyrimidine transport system permease subunit